MSHVHNPNNCLFVLKVTRVRHFMDQTRRAHCQWVCVRPKIAGVPKVSGRNSNINHIILNLVRAMALKSKVFVCLSVSLFLSLSFCHSVSVSLSMSVCLSLSHCHCRCLPLLSYLSFPFCLSLSRCLPLSRCLSVSESVSFKILIFLVQNLAPVVETNYV